MKAAKRKHSLEGHPAKGADLVNVLQAKLDAVTRQINERPRKTLGYDKAILLGHSRIEDCLGVEVDAAPALAEQTEGWPNPSKAVFD